VTDGSIQLNPARDLKVAMSKRDKEMVAIPTIEEMRTLFAKVDELSRNPIPWLAKSWRRYRAMIYLTAFTGLRASEMRGLPWTNVDLAKGILKVTQRADEDRQIGRPKSAAGYREISLAPEMVKMLLDWKGECPPGVNKLVFPNGLGNVENLANIHRRCWYPLQERAGIVAPGTGEGSYSWHSLRHFRASVLIASGATPKEIMTEMGHSSITMTFNTYGHLFPDTKGERKRRAEAIEQSILG
jgi:integrase